MITAMTPSSGVDFFQDIQVVSSLHEELVLESGRKNFRNVEQIVKDNADMLVKHWKATLCMTALSHDFVITHLILLEIVKRFDAVETADLFAFIMHLDRLIEIDIAHQISSMVRAEVNADKVGLLYRIDSMRATRSVIKYFIEAELKVCPLNKSNVPSYLGTH